MCAVALATERLSDYLLFSGRRGLRSRTKGGNPMSTVPGWRLVGDWFDICSCDIPCPCEFAQAPTKNACEGMLAWHIREGHYGEVRLDGLMTHLRKA